MDQVNLFLQPINQVLYTLLLLCVTAVLYKIFSVLNDVSKITKRVETLTDVKAWVDIFKFFKKK